MKELTELLDDHVADLPEVTAIRQQGLMVGIELGLDRERPFPAERAIGAKVCEAVRKLGVILRPLGDVVVLLPPLSITGPELRFLVEATRAAMDEVVGAEARDVVQAEGSE